MYDLCPLNAFDVDVVGEWMQATEVDYEGGLEWTAVPPAESAGANEVAA